MYTYFLNAPAMTSTVLTQTILLGILPFNLIKGLLLSAVVILLFKTMKTWLDKQRAIFS
jgi:riboflavin transporter FmnP